MKLRKWILTISQKQICFPGAQDTWERKRKEEEYVNVEKAQVDSEDPFKESGCWNLWQALLNEKTSFLPCLLNMFEWFDLPIMTYKTKRQRIIKALFCFLSCVTLVFLTPSIHSQHHFKFIIQILFYIFPWMLERKKGDVDEKWKWRRMKGREKK